MLISWSSGRRLEHGYHIIVPILFTIVGCVVMITTLNVGARYFSMILLVIGPFVGLNVRFPTDITHLILTDGINSFKSHGKPLLFLAPVLNVPL
jgi:hypothetical protein